MTKKPLLWVFLALLLGAGVWVVTSTLSGVPNFSAVPTRAAADSFTKKLMLLTSEKEKPAPHTVEFSQAELDGYLYHEVAPSLPKGLQAVRIQLLSGSLQANAKINFDEFEKNSGGGKNLLLSTLLAGEHSLDIFALLRSENHTGYYEVSKVLLDEKEIPKPLVDLLIQKYVVPKYPAVKPNSPIPLPYRIEKLDVQQGKLIVYQTR